MMDFIIILLIFIINILLLRLNYKMKLFRDEFERHTYYHKKQGDQL